MKADFLDAHERHWSDAEHLLQVQRWANADHLYGMAAECGLKRLMLAFGMPYDTSKDRPEHGPDRVHANGVWARFESYRSGRVKGDYELPPSNPFDNWDVSDRYAHQSHFDQAHVQAHQAGAIVVRELIEKAQREGLLIKRRREGAARGVADMSRGIFASLPDPVPTFDEILPIVRNCLKAYSDLLDKLSNGNDENDRLLVNRDLNGRVRLILPEWIKESAWHAAWSELASDLMRRLEVHGYPENAGILFETNLVQACRGAISYPLDGSSKVWIVDRLATETNWTHIEPETRGVPRIVFFSIKGGVGRSTALAATAWHLAQTGKRVLVLDVDLESPCLSSALLPPERQPMYGITDWLVEDLVDNGDTVFEDMVATSNLSHDGEIYVVPAHGDKHGEYIAKLGRVWMPGLQKDGTRETWSARLKRLLQKLEEKFQPDVVLIDSRSGIDEIASACITDMGANLVLLFALEGSQTWNGYRMLFEQWLRAGVAQEIRERLQVVGGIVPETDRDKYLAGLREHSYAVFGDTLYDEIAPGQLLNESWNFDEADKSAPHYPWAVNWHRGFAGLSSLHGRLATIDPKDVQFIFGSLLDGVSNTIDARETS